MIIEVKGGKNVKVETVRALRGARPKRGAEMFGLILLGTIGDRQRQYFESEISDAFTKFSECNIPAAKSSH